MTKLLYLASEDWAFHQHFLVMARAARRAGLDVAVGTRLGKHEGRISSEGVRVIPLAIRRGSVGPLAAFIAIKNVAKIIRTERPDIVHCIGLPMAVLGGIAARCLGIKKIVLAPTGLGHLWLANGVHVRALRTLVRLILGRLLKSRNVHYLFENKEDPSQFWLDAHDAQLTVVGGAGVDPEHFPVTPEPTHPPIKVAVVSRMLRTKGIAEAVEATQLAIAKGASVELHLFGLPDESNPGSFTNADLVEFSKLRGIHWAGWTEDISKVWADHHIGMLLSYGEGLPRSLVEAAASGRPLITSNVVGCREVVRDGIEGFLVPKYDVVMTADRLVLLSGDPDLRQRMGRAAHERFQNKFTAHIVGSTMSSLYRRLLRSN